MKILHITPSFYPAFIYGGVIESVYQLCRHLALRGCEVKVLTTDANGPDKILDVDKGQEVVLEKNLRVRYCKRAMGASVSPALLKVMKSYVQWADVIHLTAVYSFPTIPTLFLCKILNKPVVWSPRGALQDWEGSTRPMLKYLWNKACRIFAPKSLFLHVTSDIESQESLEKFPSFKTFVIPNGVEIPEKEMRPKDTNMLRLLYMGRLHPKKGIENLLEAVKKLNGNLGNDWQLTIAGAGDREYSEEINAKIKELDLSRQVNMVGHVHGKIKEDLLENANIVVVPSFTENFSMVVAEALASGVPVIASKGTPWGRVEEIRCGAWVENNPEILAEAIFKLSKLSLHEMGERGREWMKREFSWDLRAQEMYKIYERLLEKTR